MIRDFTSVTKSASLVEKSILVIDTSTECIKRNIAYNFSIASCSAKKDSSSNWI